MSVGNSALVSVEQKLQDPRTEESLSRLLARTDEILALLDMVEGTFKRGPEYADNVNSLIQQLRKLGVGDGSFDHLAVSLQRLKKLSQSESLHKLETRVTDEKTVDAIIHLLDNIGEISSLMDMLLAALRRGPEFADNVNGLVQKFREGAGETVLSVGEQVRALNLPALRNTAMQLNAIIQSPQMQNLLASEIFGVDSITLVDRVARVAVEASIEARKPAPKIGIIAMFQMLGDPDIQTALRFAFGFAKKLGRELSQDARAIDSKKSD